MSPEKERIAANDLAAHLQQAVILLGQCRTLLSMTLPCGTRANTLHDIDDHCTLFEAALEKHFSQTINKGKQCPAKDGSSSMG